MDGLFRVTAGVPTPLVAGDLVPTYDEAQDRNSSAGTRRVAGKSLFAALNGARDFMPYRVDLAM
jgi:hypothetical protein